MNEQNIKIFKSKKAFILESGKSLQEIEIAYTTRGHINKDRSNAVWIIHALTGNANPEEWWKGLVGTGKIFNPEKYFIVCANNPGSCYGSTGPESINPKTKKKYRGTFPTLTIRDTVKAFELLRKHLRLKKIHIASGGSLGGQILLQWASSKPELFEYIIPIATNAFHSAWGIAFNETQRMALKHKEFGLETARAIAILSYRSYNVYCFKQTDNDGRIDGFSASSYQRYQGEKLRRRFSPDSYYTLSKVMDSHRTGYGKFSVRDALQRIKSKTLVIGIKSDLLFPVTEQKFIKENIPGAKIKIIDSLYGHDGFLIEYKKIEKEIKSFLKN